jgi:mannose-6-phosphate isomerase
MKMNPIYAEDRPWGRFNNLVEADKYKVKVIEVKPQSRLSLQSHQQRSEHWIVVQGTAIITNGDDTRSYPVGAHVFIPVESKHRLENPSDDVTLQIVEVQLGDYLGEDDIIRYEDDYKR